MQRNSHHKPLDVEDIARRHRRHVYRLVRRFAADEVEALDLTREVFLRVFLQRKDYGSESDFLVHLYRIAVKWGLLSRRGAYGALVALTAVVLALEFAIISTFYGLGGEL